MEFIILALIYLGAALMVSNIWCFYKYMHRVGQYGNWEDGNRRTLRVPFVLIIMFLIGYVIVGMLGDPDIVMALILFFGSVFVAIIIRMLENVTSHIQETGQLQAELKASEESNRAKTIFLSNMSHEIRTPMNAVIGMGTLVLKNPDLPPEAREQMLKIDASAKHLLTLINDILDMSRIESGQMVLRDEPFRLGDILDQVGSIIQSQCDDKGLEFIQVYPEGDGGCYLGDEVKIKQVLINILGNSVKFTPVAGRITFRTEVFDEKDGTADLRFTISDTGVGMDPEYIPKIFESFSMEDDSSTSHYGGSGLGMAITKKIIEMMDGDIQVESAKNVGTTFTVTATLPITEMPGSADVTAVPAVSSTDDASDIPGGSDVDTSAGDSQASEWRILFAEDVEINAEILGDLLEIEDISSEWAENGQVAVDKFSASEPGYYDAILMDMRMPVKDGLTATREIRALDRPDAKTIPIIALTANAFYNDVKDCREAGMNAHLPKPVDSEQLIGVLTSLISGGSADK
jgi:signal transduction histidine kinase/CheY-like chemotaxis protein